MLTFHRPHRGGRIIASLSEVQVGAIHPGQPLQWRLNTLGGPITGSARTELAAQNAMEAALLDHLRLAGLGRVG